MRSRELARALLTWGLVACALFGCASPPAPARPAPRPAPSPEPAAPAPTPPVEPADEVPAIPPGETAQKELLGELQTTCDLHHDLYRLPSDLHAAQCQERLERCGAAIHPLAVLAASVHPAVRGDALVAAATIHNRNDCALVRTFHPCDMEREHPGHSSELCSSLSWVPEALADGVRSDAAEVRHSALRGLSSTTVPQEVAIPVLRAFLRDVEPNPNRDVSERWTVTAAIGGLRRFTSNAAPAMPELLRLLELGALFHPQVHAELLATVAAIGDAAAPAKPLVVAALRDRRPRIRRAALEALSVLGELEDRPLVMPLLSDPDPDVARAARFARDRMHRARDRPFF